MPCGEFGVEGVEVADAAVETLPRQCRQLDLGGYTIVSLLGGVWTEEARPLTWPHVHPPEGDEERTDDAELPHFDMFRSVRTGGDTKNARSRRIAGHTQPCRPSVAQAARPASRAAGPCWCRLAGQRLGVRLTGRHRNGPAQRPTWVPTHPDSCRTQPGRVDTPRELPHSFVSLLSDAKVPIEVISRLVGHSGTAVAEGVYRHQIRPVVEEAATEMERIFPDTTM